MPGPRFRFILTPPARPAWNMAVDEALLAGCLEGRRPALRLYSWDPPGLSLGHFQRDLAGIDLAFCRRAGIPVVRRLTGGRAVLHYRELTYSVSSRFEPPLAGGVLEVAGAIARGLSAGLRRLGLEVERGGSTGSRASGTPDCFASVSRHEISWRGGKLVGSAQVRRRNGFLQHGSILLGLDEELLEGVFGPGAAGCGRAPGIEPAIGRSVPVGELAGALREGFEEALGIELEPGELGGEEQALARRLEPSYVLEFS